MTICKLSLGSRLHLSLRIAFVPWMVGRKSEEGDCCHLRHGAPSDDRQTRLLRVYGYKQQKGNKRGNVFRIRETAIQGRRGRTRECSNGAY